MPPCILLWITYITLSVAVVLTSGRAYNSACVYTVL